MRRKLTIAAALLAAVAGGALASAAVFGEGAPGRTGSQAVDVRLKAEPERSGAGQRRKAKKPRVLHLSGPPTMIDVDRLNRYIDVALRACPKGSKVLDGGVVADDTNVFVQGTYLEGRRSYHVLLAVPPDLPAADFTITSHLICLKGVR